MDEFEIKKTLEQEGTGVEIVAFPFAEIKLRITYYRVELLVDEFTSKAPLSRHSISNAEWFIEKYAPRGKNWYTKLVDWWLYEAWPEISDEIRKRHKPKKVNINFFLLH